MSEKEQKIVAYINSVPEFRNFFHNLEISKYLLAIRLISRRVDDINDINSLYRASLMIEISMLNNF